MTHLQNVPFDLLDADQEASVAELQSWLPNLVATALRLKQAHWNLRGVRFKSVHEQLDEILADVRDAVDDVAERIVTIGGAADGRPESVAKHSSLAAFPHRQITVEEAIQWVCADLAVTIRIGRECREKLSKSDAISEDLVIGVVGALEKHHWLLRSQTDSTAS